MNMNPKATTGRPQHLVDAAKISPSSVYDSPRQVVQSRILTPKQKSDVLVQWEADAIAMQAAADEGMTGGAPSRLDEVNTAQTMLQAESRLAAVPCPADPSESERATVISGERARQGSTGHNVRYVLGFSLLGTIAAFLAISLYFGAL